MLAHLARASLDCAVVVTVVWILCRALPRLPSATRALLWWCAAAKFVISLVWTTPVLLPVLPAAERLAVNPAASVREIEAIQSALSRTTGEQAEPSRALPWPALVLGGWCLGVYVSVHRGVGRWRKIRVAVRGSSPASSPIQVMTQDLCRDLGLRRVPEVRVSEEVLTPLVTGLLRPIVLVPGGRFEALSERQQRMTLCHELAHLKRSDLWLGSVPALAERLFFFHPLAHIAAREYVFWREAACDAAVLQAVDAAPQEYGRLLLDLGVARRSTSLAAAGAPWSFSVLKRRIVMLRDPSSRSITSRFVASAVVGLALAAIAPLHLVARAPASPAAIAASAAPETATQQTALRARNELREADLNFVLFLDENRTTMSGSVPGDINRAKRLKRAGEPMLWFRMAGREYVVRDQAVLRDIHKLWEPVDAVGDEQGKVGEKQGAIGAQQGAIGSRQGEVGAEQGRIGERQGKIGIEQGKLAERELSRSLTSAQKAEFEKQRRELNDQMRELDREMGKRDVKMRELDTPMGELNEQMKALDRQMSVLNRRMEEAVKRAEEEMRTLLDRAISSGAAQAVK